MTATLLQRAREELGTAGLIGLVLLAGAVVFLLGALEPLEGRRQSLDAQLARGERAGGVSQGRDRASDGAARLAAFYEFFETGEAATGWLARLHAAGAAAGVEIRSADYTLHKTGTRLARYEIVLPVTGSYPQIRAFLRNALADIPVLSLDQVQIKREQAQGGKVQAEARLTLHLLETAGTKRAAREPKS
jgi:hypothetical protein